MAKIVQFQASCCRYTIELLATLFLGSVIVGGATPGRAEVKFEGSVTELRVTTSNDAISDVLSGLAATFNVRYRTAIRLDATANATYAGSLRQVIARLLDGYNYLIKNEQDAFEVVVIGSSGEKPVPAPAMPAARSKTIASQWR